MRHLYKALCLVLLLLSAQQGALIHELSHVFGTGTSKGGLRVQSDGAAETSCSLCPAFAQAVTPAFSHSFHIPLLVRFALELISEPRYSAIDAAVPRPRSRGPPHLS
jgi:hypothetical protein